MEKILIIGKIPLPIGGVSIHVKRLLDHLENNDIMYSFYDLKRFSLWSFICAIRKNRYAHLHTSSPELRLLFSIICLFMNTKSIITIHGNLDRFNRMRNIMDKLAVRLCNVPIVLNKYSYSTAYKINKNTQIISSYLPPLHSDSLPKALSESITQAKKKYTKIVSTNASAMSTDVFGQEIYGVDFLIKLFMTNKDYFFIISDPSGDYYRKYNTFCSEYDNILIINYPHSFYSLLKTVDIYIRNTSTDGDSLSIHEALDLDVCVIASRVVDRPDGVYLIERNSKDDILDILNKIKNEKMKRNSSKDEFKIITFYKSITNKANNNRKSI